MKIIMKVIGGICVIIGVIEMIGIAIILIEDGPKKTLKWMKDGFHWGYNYRF